MGHHHAVLDGIAESTADLRERIPEVYRGFGRLHHAALEDGALKKSMKELIALAIAIHEGCDGCIASHARGAARAGASPQETAEMIGVAVLMGGGPATIYGPRAWEAFNEFSEI
jgi:AhpD family alkylhydroperoxidase